MYRVSQREKWQIELLDDIATRILYNTQDMSLHFIVIYDRGSGLSVIRLHPNHNQVVIRIEIDSEIADLPKAKLVMTQESMT